MSNKDVKDLVKKISDLLDNHMRKIDDKEEAFRVLAHVCIHMAAFPLEYLDPEGRGIYQQIALEGVSEVMENYRSFRTRQEAH